MDFLLDYNLKEVQRQMQEQLADYSVTEGIRLQGELGELNIENAYLAPESIKVDIGLKGKLKLQVNGIN